MEDTGFTCALPLPPGDRVLLAHGEGAKLTRRLIRDLVLKSLDNPYLRVLGDGAVLPPIEGPVVFSTDSYVITPLIFPGGDIGRLAVHGTINDLAACGAEPLYLSLGLMIEEGFPIERLAQILGSVADAARASGVLVVTGDTKVLPRGSVDGLFLNTTGLGRLRPGIQLGWDRIQPGDHVLVSGTIGDHGLAILAAREGLVSDPDLLSDTAPLHGMVAELLSCGADVRWLRDPTRGGVSAVLHEVADATGYSVVINESSLPLSDATRGLSELLGLDPLHVANEGKMLAIVARGHGTLALECLRRHTLGRNAAIIGEVTTHSPASILLKGTLGVLSVLDEPSGSPLPRIC